MLGQAPSEPPQTPTRLTRSCDAAGKRSLSYQEALAREIETHDVLGKEIRPDETLRRSLINSEHQIRPACLPHLRLDGPVVPERVAQLEGIQLLRETHPIADIQPWRQKLPEHE